MRTPGMLQVMGIAVLVIVAEVVAVGILTGAFSSQGSAGPGNAGPRLARLTEANPRSAPQHAQGQAAVSMPHATPAPAAQPAPNPAPAPNASPPPPQPHQDGHHGAHHHFEGDDHQGDSGQGGYGQSIDGGTVDGG